MIKLLMSCDDCVYLFHGKYYAKNQEKFDFYQRYLRIFDKVRLVLRCEEEISFNNNHVLINDGRIELFPVPVFHGPIQYAKVYLKVLRALRNVTQGCDVAILRLPSTIGQRVCKIVIKKGLPFATEIVYDAFDDLQQTHGLYRLIIKRIDENMRESCYLADGVSCVTSRYLQKHYFSKKPKAFTSNYSSLSLDNSFYTSERKYPTHIPLIIGHVANQVAFNGRKGHNEILKAIALLKKQGLNVNVKFVGADYKDGIAKLKDYANKLNISQQVEFLGYLQREELSIYLENVDIFVLPTKAEGLPRVIIEAMAKGLPCITTNVSGNSELVEKGFLVEDFYDVNSLSEHIKKLIENKSLYEEQSKINIERSYEYENKVLQVRRDIFYRKLKELANKKK